MKIKLQFLLAICVFILVTGALLTYDLYVKPHVLAKDVVVIKAPKEGLPEHTVLSDSNVYYAKVSAENIPDDVVTNIGDVIGKRSNVVLTNGTILTQPLVDVQEVRPGENEGIYPIPKEAIYAINGTLRARDIVKILLMPPAAQLVSSDGTISEMGYHAREVFIDRAKVAYVRAEDNNDVKDTQTGNTTNRSTSTGKVSYPELLLNDEQGLALKEKLSSGYRLWIVRVE